jgi:hypothetical protein
VPLCPPKIPHALSRDRTRASAVGGRRLTAWAMARPSTQVAPTLKFYASFMIFLIAGIWRLSNDRPFVPCFV